MKTHSVRLGHATNSSSVHSIVHLPDAKEVLSRQSTLSLGDYISNDKNGDLHYVFQRDGKSKGESSQFDWNGELKEMSLRFPDVLFTLDGEGEEARDL